MPLVELRAKAMQEAVPAGEGAMAAMLGLDAATVKAACDEAAQGQVVQAVNFNSPEQTVIAGHKAAVERAAEACKAKGAKRALLLPVSAPFHCSLMQPAAEQAEGRAWLIRCPVGAGDSRGQQRRCGRAEDPDVIRAALVRQAAAPVRWVETMRAMQAAGVPTSTNAVRARCSLVWSSAAPTVWSAVP